MKKNNMTKASQVFAPNKTKYVFEKYAPLFTTLGH